MVEYIISPQSGRRILVGGPTYQKLEASRYSVQIKRAKRFSGTKTRRTPSKGPPMRKVLAMPKAKPAPLRETLLRTPPSRKAKKRTLEVQIARKSKGRGIRTRGWRAAAPQKGTERHELKQKCGDKCFLRPESEGFPICAALREGKGCAIDCRGVVAAKVRARQYKYPKVAQRAERISKEKACLRG